jgi:hypothetical protein
MFLSTSACIEERFLGTLQECGNGSCEEGESPSICPKDCLLHTCGNKICEAGEPTTCAADCQATSCGDGVCDTGEDSFGCVEDCPWGVCGNFACEPGEDPASCPEDCFPGFCGNGLCEDFETSAGCPLDCAPTRSADVLFVVDNSGSMADEQAMLRDSFPALLEAVRGSLGETPDLHVGVISTDIGTSPHAITFCEGSGDDGRLQRGGASLAGVPWMVDVAPEGCAVQQGTDGQCASHSCGAAHCQHEPVTTLVEDAATGCPRCRNFPGAPAATFSDQAGLGIQGCGFEQPLEALYRALDGHPENQGFLREDAILAIVFLTDEDDCSARDPELFSTDSMTIDSVYGPLTSYRCFEFGITCDVNNRTQSGPRSQCTPREDPGAMLHPLSRYWSQIRSIKQPGQVLVAALAGPVANGQVVVGMDEYQQPALEASCTSGSGGAAPAIRLRTFASAFNDAWALSVFGHSSICDDGYDLPMGELGAQLGRRLSF